MDSPYPYQEYQVNNRAKKIGALILALILYLLFMGPLVIDIIPARWRLQPFINVQDASIPPQKSQRAQPAPVKYAPPPQQPTTSAAQPPPPAPAKPIQVPPMPEQLPEKPREEQDRYKPVPKSREQESGAPTSEVKEQSKVQAPKPHPLASQPTALKQEQATPPLTKREEPEKPLKELPLRTTQYVDTPQRKKPSRTSRASRAKWFKEPSLQKKEDGPSQQSLSASNTLSKQLMQGLSEHMQTSQRARGAGEGSLYTGDPAGDFEINLFYETFDRNFCKASEFNPLFISTGLPLKPHTIVFEVTCNKQRKAIHVSLPQPSYDQRLSAYVTELCTTMSIPQLPSRWPEDTLIIRRTISLHRPYFESKISFSAGQFWT